MNIVRSMLNYSNVLLSLLTYELRSDAYFLNRIPSKEVLKTPYELWTGRKPSFKNLHIWGYKAEVRAYNPHEKKLDVRNISGFFIGHPEKSKGHSFYCPDHSKRIIESSNAQFIENGKFNGSEKSHKMDIMESRGKYSSPKKYY